MLRNVAGQRTLGVQLRDKTNGNDLDTGVSCFVAKDGATGWTAADTGGGGVLVNVGSGSWYYEPTQAETDADVLRYQYRHATGLTALESYDTRIDTIVDSGQPREKTRDSDVLTTGTQTGTSANTLVRDGAYWQITSVAAGIDAELVFNIGTADENPSTAQIFGRFTSGKNRQTVVQGFNFTQNAWEKLGADVLSNEAGDKSYIFGLGRSYVRRGQVGTPGSDGDVRIRFLYDTNVSGKVQAGDNLFLDKVAVYYTSESITIGEIVQALVLANPNRNYPDSEIVINSENGQPGTVFGVNGTPGNPSNNLADAITLATTGGYTKFVVNGNTNLLLTQAFPDWTFILAQGSTLDTNGQDVDNSSFLGGTIQGVTVVAATGIRAVGCVLKGVTSWGTFQDCRLPAADSLVANGAEVYLLDCESARPGAVNPSIKGGSVAGLSLSVIKYGGGIDISGLANDANVTISGKGSFTLADAATTATVISSGQMRRLGALPTGINFIDEARITQTTPLTIIAGQDVTATNMRGTDGAQPAGSVDLNADQSGVTIGTVNTCVSNDDMRGTDGAVTSLAGVALEATSQAIGTTVTDTNTKISSPNDYKADVSGLSTFDPASDPVDVDRLGGDAEALNKLANSIKTTVRGTAAAAGATTILVPIKTANPDAVSVGQFRGKVISFADDTATPSLRGQSTRIDTNTTTEINIVATDPLTTVPAEDDAWAIG